MIGLLDYGVGNIGSLGNALDHLGLPFTLSAEPVRLERCDRLLLPGVGAFAHAMACLRERGMEEFVREWARSGRPLLGICLGMQLLFSESSEDGQHTGLGLISGRVVGIRHAPRRVHMGWNLVQPVKPHTFIPEPGYGYFVHAYHCVPDDAVVIVASSEYGSPLAAAIHQDNILGVQFHPEKSQAFGLNILRRFADGPL